tara:strand:+ start:237 stop:779 length:543 start_codon:yes stop_codon:yes gene_type:complete
MSEEKQVSNEPVGNVDTPPTEVANADASVIAESKKYRKRSQAAEARVAELEAQINSFETDKLKEKEEFKALYEKVSVENESNKALAEKWVNYEATKREQLLQQVPDEEKAEWNDSPLNLLEKYVTKFNTEVNNPSHIGSQSREKKLENGGYGSKTEWLQKDPSGYREAKKKGLLGYFGQS